MMPLWTTARRGEACGWALRFGRLAVRRPAGMADADWADERFGGELRLEVLQLSLGATPSRAGRFRAWRRRPNRSRGIRAASAHRRSRPRPAPSRARRRFRTSARPPSGPEFGGASVRPMAGGVASHFGYGNVTGPGNLDRLRRGHRLVFSENGRIPAARGDASVRCGPENEAAVAPGDTGHEVAPRAADGARCRAVAALPARHHSLSSGAPRSGGRRARHGGDRRRTQGDLRVSASLCTQSDDNGAPASPVRDRDDHCPFCWFAAQSATLTAPVVPALPRPIRHLFLTLGAAPQRRPFQSARSKRSRARAPPAAI